MSVYENVAGTSTTIYGIKPSQRSTKSTRGIHILCGTVDRLQINVYFLNVNCQNKMRYCRNVKLT